MAVIRLVLDKGLRTEKEGGVFVTDVQMDSDGYLQFFRIDDPFLGTKNLHSFRRHKTSLADLSINLLGAATSLRSAKGLLEDFAKIADRAHLKPIAGKAGLVFGSVALLHKFLQTRPFDVEGYYESNGQLWLPRLIHSANTNDYAPALVPGK